MRSRSAAQYLYPYLCLLISFAFPRLCWGQANINEGLETAFVYVDGTNGNDITGNGSITSPYQTIGKGVSVAETNNHASIGTQVNIQPGTYRESISMNSSSRDTSLPMTFQAVTNGTVTISGSAPITGWTKQSKASYYSTNWTYKFPGCAQISGCPTAQNIVLQPEMMVVNGAVMTQVLSLTELLPGSFYVDQNSSAVYLYPPSGTDMSTAAVETAALPSLWAISGKSNIVLRGLTFQYANNCPTSAAVQVGGPASNVLVDTVTVQWNNGQGLSISNPFTHFTVQNSIANHNGSSGFQEFQTLYGLWTNDTADFNNWRGAQGGYYACNLGGFHPFQAHSDTISGMTLGYNQTYGVHWDTDNADITVSGLVSTNNLIGGIFSEKNEGPLSISTSHLCNGNALMGAGGLAIRNSTDVSFTNGTLVNDPPSQIEVFGQPGGIEITNWQTGEQINLITQNFTNTGNVIQGDDSSQYLFQDANLGGSDWTAFETSFVSNSNTWWNASASNEFVVPSPQMNTVLDLAGWQGNTGQDLLSNFAAPKTDPAAACEAIVPDAPDYWVDIGATSLTLNPVGQAIFSLTATPLDFSGTVSLLADGISKVTGLTAAFSPASIALSKGVAATATLTLTGLTTTPAGIYPITVVANSGNLTRMVTAEVTVPQPGIWLSTVLAAFGNQQVNTASASQTVTVTNHAKGAITISGIVATPSAFSQTNDCTTLKGGASCTVTVTFTPNVVASFNGTLTVTNTGSTPSEVVTLTGTGTAAPTATLVPGSLKFGSVTQGTTSAAQSSTLTDTSTTVALNVSSIVLSGSNPGDFLMTKASTCPNTGTIKALATCLVTVTFTPTATGSRSATLTVYDNTGHGSQAISLSGTGTSDIPTATLLPASLQFGSVTQGTTSAAQSSTLTDTSKTVALSISSISLSGKNPGDFQMTKASTCPSAGALKALATCLVTVTFTPTATGARSATLTVYDNTSHGNQAISLSGTGAAAIPTATLLPSTLKFGSVTQGTTSASQSSTLTDTSTIATLKISTLSLSGANPGDFAIASSSTCKKGGTLNPLATCAVTVTFTPSATGSRSATLTVSDNTSAGQQTISLSGTGTAAIPTATLLPSSLKFGSVTQGTTSASQSSTLTDTSTIATLNISTLSLSGTNPGDFAIASSSTCKKAGKLSPLATCVVTVTFTPSATGSRSATLTVSDNTSSGQQTVSLSGIGTAPLPTATLLPASLQFGSITVGKTSAALSSTLTDTSVTVALKINGISLSGSDADDFAVASSSTCKNGATLNPLATCLVTVTFTPAKTGSRAATLTVTDNTSGGKQTVSLSGTGQSAR